MSNVNSYFIMTNLYKDEEWKILPEIYEERWNEGQSHKNSPSIKFPSKHIGTVVFNSTGSMERYISIKLANEYRRRENCTFNDDWSYKHMVAVARLEKESRRRDEYEKEDLSVSNIQQLKTFLERYRKDKVFRGIRIYIPNPNKMNQKVVCSIRTLQGGGFTQHGFMPTGTDLLLFTENGKHIKSLTFPLSKNYKGDRTNDEYFDDAVKYFQESVLLESV